jgi:hypothetical protein
MAIASSFLNGIWRFHEGEACELCLTLQVDVTSHDSDGAPGPLSDQLDNRCNEAIVAVDGIEPWERVLHSWLARERLNRAGRIPKRHSSRELTSCAVSLDPGDQPLGLMADLWVPVVDFELVEFDQDGRCQDQLEASRVGELPALKVNVVQQRVCVWHVDVHAFAGIV